MNNAMGPAEKTQTHANVKMPLLKRTLNVVFKIKIMSYSIFSVPIYITTNLNHTCSILFPPYKVNKTLKLE